MSLASGLQTVDSGQGTAGGGWLPSGRAADDGRMMALARGRLELDVTGRERWAAGGGRRPGLAAGGGRGPGLAGSGWRRAEDRAGTGSGRWAAGGRRLAADIRHRTV